MASRSPEDVGLLNGASSDTCQGGEEVEQEMSLKDAFLAPSLRLVSSCRLYFLSHPLLETETLSTVEQTTNSCWDRFANS